MESYSKKQRLALVSSSRNLKTQLVNIVPLSVRYLNEPRPSRDSVEEQHRAISMIGETCDDLLSQTEEWRTTYWELLTRFDPLKGEDSDYLALQKLNNTFEDIDAELTRG